MSLKLMAGCSGLAAAPWLPTLIPMAYLYTALLSALLVWRLSNRVGVLLMCFLLGFSYSSHLSHRVNEAILAPQFEAKTTTLTGRVSGLPKQRFLYGKNQQSFNFELTEPLCFGAVCQPALTTLRVSWAREGALLPGQIWRITAKLKRPRGLSNPAGFDYERWLVTQGVHATATVKSNPTNQHQLIATTIGLDTWRWQIANALDQRLESLQHLALIKALLLGDKRGVDQHLWQLFSVTGTTHLVVVSGLHIGIVAFLSFQLARFLTATLDYRLANLITSLSSCAGAVLYSLIAGLSLPTQRAMMMVVIVVLLSLLARHYRASTLLLVVVMLCLMLDPLAILGSSFWLSFAAVTAIMMVSTGRVCQPQHWWAGSWLSAQWAVFIGLTPFLLLIFNKAPLLSIIINCVAVPFFSLLLVPLLCVSALAESANLPIDFLWQWLDTLIHYFIASLALARDYQVLINIAEFNRFNAVMAAVASVVLLMPLKAPQKVLAVCLLLPLFIGRSPAVKPGDVTVSVIDIGQGLSVLIQTQNHSLLYDVGSSWGDSSMATQVVWPLLQSKKISQLDRLVISHNDNDHAGGLLHLLELADIAQINTGEQLEPQSLLSSSCHQQSPWLWDGVEFKFIDYPDQYKDSGNNHSCILSINSNGYRLLLPGDIEDSVEAALAQLKPATLQAQLLIAPHHGSISSSSWLFLRHVDPELVIFSTAYGNRFNHPHPEISKRYKALGIRQYNTANLGAVMIDIKSGVVTSLHHQRQKQRFFWQR